jgi:hypothetical protein
MHRRTAEQLRMRASANKSSHLFNRCDSGGASIDPSEQPIAKHLLCKLEPLGCGWPVLIKLVDVRRQVSRQIDRSKKGRNVM